MAKLIIRGGKQLGGTYTPPGNKNAALPMLAASLLTDEPVILENLPLINDVRTMLSLLEKLGVHINLKGHTATIQAAGIRKTRLDPVLCSKVRSSILFAGPLAARHGRATVSPPGGDMIGRRPIDAHIDALRKLGIHLEGKNCLRFRRKNLKGADILLEEASVTATENAVMAAVLAKGRTTIFNAACEPHVQDLCRMLNGMGAVISGIGTNRIIIEGVESLHGVRYRIQADYIDSVSFLAASAITGGALTINEFNEHEHAVISPVLSKLGLKFSFSGGILTLPAGQNLRMKNAFGSAIPKIEDGPWPNFPSDLMSVAIVTATRSKGTMLFFEKMFESRMYFVDRLIEMGARIVQCDPHRVIVNGPVKLAATTLSSPDIRAGVALLLAALSAKGESVIHNAQCIDRGYENIDHRLRALGADIERAEN